MNFRYWLFLRFLLKLFQFVLGTNSSFRKGLSGQIHNLWPFCNYNMTFLSVIMYVMDSFAPISAISWRANEFIFWKGYEKKTLQQSNLVMIFVFITSFFPPYSLTILALGNCSLDSWCSVLARQNVIANGHFPFEAHHYLGGWPLYFLCLGSAFHG